MVETNDQETSPAVVWTVGQRVNKPKSGKQAFFLREDKHQMRAEEAYFLPNTRAYTGGMAMAAGLLLQDLLMILFILLLSNFSHVRCLLPLDVLDSEYLPICGFTSGANILAALH